LNPARNPKEIDLIITESQEQGTEPGSSLLGIYILDGNSLRVCCGKTRPQRFESITGAEHQLLNYDRTVEPRAEVKESIANDLNGRAWELATEADASKRHGAKAVELATRACGLDGHKTSQFLDTLAAAYAEVGKFDDAVKWEMRAIEQNTDAGNIDGFRARLVLYKRKVPYHQGG